MVREVWALDYERYSGGRYASEQLEAEQTQRGLWSGSFVPPWEWREKVEEGAGLLPPRASASILAPLRNGFWSTAPLATSSPSRSDSRSAAGRVLLRRLLKEHSTDDARQQIASA